MNIEIANRLVNLRRKHGFSQEELAARLGISRQAVSKWERAESSPDTDNLILLARLYGVSLDALLQTDDPVEPATPVAGPKPDVETQSPQNPDPFSEFVLPEIQIPEADMPEFPVKEPPVPAWRKVLFPVYPILLMILYLILGFGFHLWHPGWLVFLTVPIFYAGLRATFPMAIVLLYLVLGLFFHLWHPGWIVFLLIPVYYCIAGGIRSLKKE